MNHWMFNCRKMSYKLSVSLDKKLPLWERLAIRMHLSMCKFCTDYASQIRTISHLMDLKDKEIPSVESCLSDEAKMRIKQSLYKELFKLNKE